MKGIGLLFLLGLVNYGLGYLTYLSGKHLIVGVQVCCLYLLPLLSFFKFVIIFKDAEVHLYVKRNASGHIVRVDGVAAQTLATLALRLNFT